MCAVGYSVSAWASDWRAEPQRASFQLITVIGTPLQLRSRIATGGQHSKSVAPSCMQEQDLCSSANNYLGHAATMTCIAWQQVGGELPITLQNSTIDYSM